MSLHPDARHTLIYELVRVIRPLSGVAWEPVGDLLAEFLAEIPLLHRGQGVKGNPQGYTIDSYSAEGDVAAQYGTADNYFDDLKKPAMDYDHVRRLLPMAKKIYLLSSQQATAAEFTAVTAWRDQVWESDGIVLDVYDARRLAEHIADVVIEDEAAYDTLAGHLEPLRQLRDLYASTNNIPSLPSGVVVRAEVEDAVVAALNAHGIAFISGLSGDGKSVTALSVAHQLQDQFAWPIWTTELSVSDVKDLGAVDVARRGMGINLEAMLRSRQCLLVLDDLQSKSSIEQVLEQIRDARFVDARVIVTSQQFIKTPFTVVMPPMSLAAARQLLEYQAERCPDTAFAAIMSAVGGHPMALRLLNGLARDGAEWADVAAEVSRVGELTVPERAQRLVDVVLSHRRAVLERALALFAWCRSPRVHSGFFRSAIGTDAARTLQRYGLVTGDEPDTLRLHDLIWSSLPALTPALTIPVNDLENALDAYVRSLANSEARAMLVKHLARVHKSLLWDILHSGNWRYGHLYASLQSGVPRDVTASMLPSAIELANTVAADGDAFGARAACELAEALVRLQKGTLDAPAVTDAELLAPFDSLLASAFVPAEEKVYVRHHRARALKLLGRHEEAVADLEGLLASVEPDEGPPVVRLLLARTLTELPRGVCVPDGGDRARELLLGLLREARDEPGRVSMPATLAAAELLRRHAAGVDLATTLPEFIGLLEPLIMSAARRGLPFGPLAFGALAKVWRSVDRDSFWRVFDALPAPSLTDVTHANERTAWAEVYENAAEHDPARREANLTQALTFFAAADNPYGQGHAARLETQLGRPGDAVLRLRAVLEKQIGANDHAWTLRHLANAELALDLITEARSTARDACERLPEGSAYGDDFQRWRASILE
ncbi:MAG: hypothetical protein IT355_13260 [Gemmatimonadaceae bacterium]|nr:hypothetical protein [Gemmatimonadaceae bacterium]